jgi:hypothetical protein
MTDTQPQEKVYAAGDTITIMRGKTRGATAQVLYTDETNKTCVVKYADGTVGVVNHVNVKTPTEKTISATALAGLVQASIDATGLSGLDPQMAELIERLTDAGLDTSSKIRVPASDA